MAFSTYKDVRVAGGRFVSLFTLQEEPFSRACALDTSKILEVVEVDTRLTGF